MKLFKTLCALAILVVTSKAVFGQGVNSSNIGFVPTGIYQHTDIDSVNMENGNAVIHIPLFGYPQRGSSLKLNFSINANTSLWQENFNCYDEFAYCNHIYTMAGTAPPNYSYGQPNGDTCVIGPGSTPAVFPDQLGEYWCVSPEKTQICDQNYDVTNLLCDVFLTNIFYIVEPTGEKRRLQYDASNYSQLRATDSSGFLLHVDDPQPYYLFVPQGCSNGMCDLEVKDLSNSVLTNSRGDKLSAGMWTDTNTNSIYSDSSGNMIDSVNRIIPPIGPASDSTIGCPTLTNTQYQPASSSVIWTVPGPNGQQVQYLLCYANVVIQTNFWESGPQGYEANEEIDTSDPSSNGYPYSMVYYEETHTAENVLQSVVLPDGNYWGFVYDAANPNDSNSVGYGTLTKIITPEGSSVSYGYGMVYGCYDGDTEYPPTLYINQRTLTDVYGNMSTWKYGYSQLNLNGANLNMVATDPYNNDTVYSFISSGFCSNLISTITHYAGSSTQGNVLQTENTAFQTVKSLTPPGYSGYWTYANAFPQTATVTDEVGNQRSTNYSYDNGFVAAMPYCYEGKFTQLDDADPPGDLSCTHTLPNPIATSGVSFGLQTSQSVYDFNGSALTSTTTSYAWQNGSNASTLYGKNLLALPSKKAVYGGSGLTNLLAQTNYGYDGNGNQTSVSKLLTSSNTLLTTSIGYDTHGMPISVTDPRGNTTISSYTTNSNCPWDSTGLYPSEIQQPTTNGIQHNDYYCHDANTGNLMWHTDQNGSSPADPAHTTQYTYNDPFGRLTKVLAPPTPNGQGETDTSYSDATPSPWTVTTTVKADPNPSQTSVKAYDSFGRMWITTAPNGATQETTYDPLSRVASVTNPHFTTPSSTDGITTYTYDPLGRKTYQYQPDGSSHLQWTYSGNLTTITDEVGNSTQQTADALGRLKQVVEPGGLTTQYSYDALNNLLSVNQLGNTAIGDTPRTRSFSYDSLSRLLTAFNPETGTVGYTYDANSNVLTKTDARGVVTSYTYDALNRLLSKSYSDGATPLSCYLYDSAAIANGSGRLASAWTQSASTGCSTSAAFWTKRNILAYDAMGRITSEQQFTPASQASGAPYSPAYTYDLAGNLLTSTSGVGPTPTATPFIFTHMLDNAGHLQTLASNWTTNYVNGTTNVFPATLFSTQTLSNSCSSATSATNAYSAFGGLQNAMFGNGLKLNRSYDSRMRTNCENDTGTGATTGTPGSATVTITGSEQSQ
jgi:YD repeat-containing protein